MTKKTPESLLPLTPAVLHILLALADGERHGYAVAQEVEAMSNGQVRMGPGTLYGSILRMSETELVEEVIPRHRGDGDERRRYYRSTPFGKRVLSRELARLDAVINLARRKQLLPTGT
ncbi:MAG: PadR family transcriptional regulator [Gemmatimonadetes bacterium]|nr:PadR family transcriptional regulator [Gemmatimonadota bacterium]